ncbi:hypothetical protein C8R44DRAFT_725950 [Mycena epipterygia]|nr:hypothetical protein C8R44DRAFT_725950 [Mycena epipterygia]
MAETASANLGQLPLGRPGRAPSANLGRPQPTLIKLAEGPSKCNRRPTVQEKTFVLIQATYKFPTELDSSKETDWPHRTVGSQSKSGMISPHPDLSPPGGLRDY